MPDQDRNVAQERPGIPQAPQIGEEVRDQVGRIQSELTAHRLVMEALIHGICFEVAGIDRTRLLKVLDVTHRELASGLGYDNDVVQAFGEQLDRMRCLLVIARLQAATDLVED